MANIRSFVAISISEEARIAIAEMIRELQDLDSSLRWVKPDNIHLTLKFLGGVQEEKLPDLKQALEFSLSGMMKFFYEITGVGCFPTFRNSRVLWVGVKNSDGYLVKLKENIEKEFFKINFPKETRKFNPHLTVARVKARGAPELQISRFQNYNIGRFKVEVNKVILMRSDLHPTGPRYTPIYNLSFGNDSGSGFKSSRFKV